LVASVPFANVNSRDKHFLKHGHKLGAASALDYEAMADAFMQGPMNASTHECIQASSRDRLRLDFHTARFGVGIVQSFYIRTFFPVEAFNLAYRGGPGGYFHHKCTEVLT
jgi:hypothetical protein